MDSSPCFKRGILGIVRNSFALKPGNAGVVYKHIESAMLMHNCFSGLPPVLFITHIQQNK